MDFHYHRDQAQKKLEHFQEYTSSHGIDLDHCLIIGNGDSDVGLFKSLPYGIAVDTELHPEVKNLAYAVISNLNELKLYL